MLEMVALSARSYQQNCPKPQPAPPMILGFIPEPGLARPKGGVPSMVRNPTSAPWINLCQMSKAIYSFQVKCIHRRTYSLFICVCVCDMCDMCVCVREICRGG